MITKHKYLSIAEQAAFRQVLDALMADGHVRDYLMFTILMDTGARASELLNIRKKDIHNDDMSIVIHGLKGSNDREIPLDINTFDLLKKYARTFKKDQRLFEMTISNLQKLYGKIRPCEKNLHALRHTFAINTYKKTKDIRLLQICLGHRSLTSTSVYAQYVFGVEEMRSKLVGKAG